MAGNESKSEMNELKMSMEQMIRVQLVNSIRLSAQMHRTHKIYTNTHKYGVHVHCAHIFF